MSDNTRLMRLGEGADNQEIWTVTREMTGGFRFADAGPSLGNFPADGDDADELPQLLLAH